MLAIDTNLIVRYLVGDDAGQAARVRRLIDNNDVFVCTTVLLETEWVLRSVYRFSAAQCAKALSDFAGLPRESGRCYRRGEGAGLDAAGRGLCGWSASGQGGRL
jgi:hypothetical protein